MERTVGPDECAAVMDNEFSPCVERHLGSIGTFLMNLGWCGQLWSAVVEVERY